MNDRGWFEDWYAGNLLEPIINPIGSKEYCLKLEACAESKQSELDKANARIAQLCETLLKVHNHPDAERLQLDIFCTLCKSPDTWLSEHDKVVEVKVLEEVSGVTHERWRASATEFRYILFAMIEARKQPKEN